MKPPFTHSGASRNPRVQLPLPAAYYSWFNRLAGAVLIASISACQSLGTLVVANDVHNIDPIQFAGPGTHLSRNSSATSIEPSAPNSQTAWLNSIEALYVEARIRVEAELDADLSDVKLLIVDDQPINQEVSRESHRLIRAQFGDTAFATHFLNQVMGAQVGTYAALFTSESNTVMVSRDMLSSFENSLAPDATLRTAALMTLLIHELVHAADDQRYKIHENRALNFRASFAQSATFEGHAQWVTRQICAKHQCLSGLDALDNFMFNRDAEPALHSQPIEAISHNVLEYSYVEGERFIASLASRENGKQLIDTLLSAPPQDPIQILSPETFPDNDREERNQRLITASLDIDHPWVKGNWIGVETSPLKGVNLRSDPTQREAAIDGFTRLITSMVSMQLYDQSSLDTKPIEVTILQAETAKTATLFASTLHENASAPASTAYDESVIVKSAVGDGNAEIKAHLYRSEVTKTTPYRTTIAVSGDYLVQISGQTPDTRSQDDFAVRVLLNLQLGKLRI